MTLKHRPSKKASDACSNLSYAFYCDAHPDGTMTATKGHTKGVVAFDDNSGF